MHIVYIEICGNLSFEVGVVKKISVSLNSEKFRAYKRLKFAAQPYVLNFEKNCGAYELSILGFSKLHSKSGTVLAVTGVPMGNCIVNINRNATCNHAYLRTVSLLSSSKLSRMKSAPNAIPILSFTYSTHFCH